MCERGVWRIDVAGDVICLVAITRLGRVAGELRVPRAAFRQHHFDYMREQLDREWDPHATNPPSGDVAALVPRPRHLFLVRPV